MTDDPILLRAAQTYQPQATPEEGDQIFRAIVESVIEGILVVQDGKRVYYNPRWLEMTGYSAEEYAKIPYPTLIHPTDVRLIVNVDDQIVSGQIPNADYELRLVTRSGEIRWLAVRASRLRWDNRPAVVSVHTDITERKLAEQKLRYQATLLEKVSDAVITTDMGFIIQSWNDAAQATYGFDTAEALGQRLGLLIPTVYRDAITRDAAAELLRAHGSWQGEVRQKHKDGSDLHILSSVNILRDDDGQPVGIVAINRDITERVRAEEKVQQNEALYSAVISALREGLVVQDTSDKILMANQSAASILGLTIDQLLGKSSYDPGWQALGEDGTPLRPEEHPSMITLRTGQGVDNMIMNVQIGDDRRTTIAINSRPVMDQEQKMTGVVVTFSDITIRRQAEEALQANEEKLRAIYTAIPFPTYTWQADGDEFVLTDSNEAGRRVSQGHIMEMIGSKASVMYRDRPDILEDFARCCREKITIQREMEYVLRTTGQRSYFDVRYAYVPPDQVLVHTEDISQRKRLEAERANLNKELEERVRQRTVELQETWQRLDLATRAAQVGVWDWDVQKDILVWDETACALLGIAKADSGGKHTTFLRLVHPEDVATVEESIRTALQGATSYEKEFRIVWPDGAVRQLRLMASIHYDENQQAVRMIGVNWDVTQDKKNQQVLRVQGAALEAAANAIAIVDREGNIQWINPAFSKLTGYGQAEVIGQNPRLLKSGKHDVAFYRQMWQRILSGQTWRGQLVNRRKDGELYDEEMNISPLFDENGEISYFIAVKQDVTERKRILTELETFNATMVDREERIIELKEEINRLARELGREIPYPPIWESGGDDPEGAFLLREGDAHG